MAEYRVYWAHQPLGRGNEGELWGFQTPIAGQLSRTGFVPDFNEFDLRIAIDVLDPMARGLPHTRALRQLRELILRSFQYTYILIDASAALTSPIYVLQEALNGVSHSLAT